MGGMALPGKLFICLMLTAYFTVMPVRRFFFFDILSSSIPCTYYTVNRQNFKDSSGLFFNSLCGYVSSAGAKKQAFHARMETGQGKPVLL